MRQRLDCAVIVTSCTQAWAPIMPGVYGGRVHVRAPLPVIDSGQVHSTGVLAAAAMQLRSFDVCLLPVAPENLGWARTCLLSARGHLQTPVIALVSGLQAAALNDLLLLGVADFLRAPLCSDELRIRIQRLVKGLGSYPREESAPTGASRVSDATVASQGGQVDVVSGLVDRLFTDADSRFDALAAAAVAESLHHQQSFRAVKGKIVEHFERSYIQAALKRHSGNIAMAARTAQKHRRAFWAQMRKYNIDAAVYRPAKLDCPPGSQAG